MKKWISMALILCLLLPALALAAPKGVTLDEYSRRLEELQAPVAFASKKSQNCTLFCGVVTEDAFMVGRSFPGSDVIEVATLLADEASAGIYIASALTDDQTERLAMAFPQRVADAYSDHLLEVYSAEWYKHKSVREGNYYANFFYLPGDETDDETWLWFLLHAESEVLDKSDAIKIISEDKTLLSEAYELFYSKDK